MRLLRVFAIFTFPVVLIWFVATLTVVGSIWWWGDWLGKRSSAYPIVWRAAYLVFAAGSVALARFAWTLPRVQMHVCEMGEWEWCVDASPLAAAQERYPS